jgi:protoheme IX farnesyltransferase
MTVAALMPVSTPADLLALTKPRIVVLVSIVAASGYALGLRALPPGQWPASSPAATAWVLLHVVLGTALVAAGTGALNMIVERDVDARMRRTRRRPMPEGRVPVREAHAFAWTVSALGVLELFLWVGERPAALAALTLGSYVYAYTPLKRRTHHATLVGAVPGALPIVGGWAAAGAPLDARAAALFAIMFVWQLPHVLALGWLHRDDYARAGLRMLSVDDESGTASFRQASLAAAALVPVSLAPTALGMAGPAYFFVALVLSLLLLAAALHAARRPEPVRARRLFLATLAWLPALLAALVALRPPGSS